MAHRLSGYARIIAIEIMADKMTYISNGPCSSSSRYVKNAEKGGIVEQVATTPETDGKRSKDFDSQHKGMNAENI